MLVTSVNEPMHAIPGTYHNAQITLGEKADWPDGCQVMVEPAPLPEEFQRLANQWREETKYFSIAKRMAEHPAHQKIIAMGEKVIPLILAELERRPGHWFIALRILTGANPIPQKSRGNLKEMTDAWLKWGGEHRFAHKGQKCRTQ